MIIIDITGLTTITIDEDYQHLDTLYLSSSNSTESIDGIDGLPLGKEVMFFALGNLSIDFNDVSVNAGNIHLDTSTITINGLKKDFIKFFVNESDNQIYLDEYINYL